MDSRIHLIQTMENVPGRLKRGSSSRHESALKNKGTKW
jgi:hypothetical protein